MKYPIHNLQGAVVSEIELNPSIFEIPIKPWVVQEAVVSQQSTSRVHHAHTKDRGEVRGGGRKPWRQKGTGRARQGSIRSPLWRGGGVTFGPSKERTFTKKINQKVKEQALCMGLSQKASDHSLIILENLSFEEIKTKTMAEILKTLKLTGKKIMIALEKNNPMVIKSARNIPDVILTASNSLNIIDILNTHVIVTTVDGLAVIEKTYQSS